MFEEEYKAAFSKVTASGDTYRRVMNMAKENRKHNSTGVISRGLIAAVMVSMLVVTASAAEIIRNWFVSYFDSESEAPLSQEQVKFLEENEKHLDESQSLNGWTIELRSAIADGMKGYIMLGVTAPEGIDLSDVPKTSQTMYYGPGNDFLPKSADAVLSSEAYPDIGGVIANIGSSWQEDGDGLSNTLNYVIDVAPDVEWAEVDPFDSDTKWHIHIANLVYGFPEQTVLAEGTWDFDFNFEGDKTQIEMLEEPVKITGWAHLPDGAEIEAEVTVTSMILRPFGVTVYYGDDSDGLDYGRTGVNFTDSDAGRDPWFVVMKDGGKMELLTEGGNPIERYQYLETKLPIVLENAEYLQTNDGTKFDIPQ